MKGGCCEIVINGDEFQVNLSKTEFRQEAVKRFLNRGKQSVESLAGELGVTTKTLYLWVDKYALYNEVVRRNPSTTQKLKLIIAYDALPLDQRGSLLREHGIYSEQIEQWREAAMKNNLETLTEKNLQEILKAQQEEIKLLKQELKRKDKALAEANACILLQKKAQDLYGDEDEE